MLACLALAWLHLLIATRAAASADERVIRVELLMGRTEIKASAVDEASGQGVDTRLRFAHGR